MHAHAADFRSEVREGDAEALSEALLHDWRKAPLSASDRALCEFAEKLSTLPAGMSQEDVAALWAAGFDDRAVHDTAQVVSYFCYINRVAEALGVDAEPGMPPDPRRGEAAPLREAEVEAARAAFGSLSETGSLTIVWRCLKCNHHFPAGHALPDACPSCGAPKTEYALVEED